MMQNFVKLASLSLLLSVLSESVEGRPFCTKVSENPLRAVAVLRCVQPHSRHMFLFITDDLIDVGANFRFTFGPLNFTYRFPA